MTENQAKQIAQQQAMTRSLTYDVVRTTHGFDYFPRFYDSQGRTDKGDVVASFDCYGQRLDTERRAINIARTRGAR